MAAATGQYVYKNGDPSWMVLRTALEKIGERQLASELIST